MNEHFIRGFEKRAVFSPETQDKINRMEKLQETPNTAEENAALATPIIDITSKGALTGSAIGALTGRLMGKGLMEGILRGGGIGALAGLVYGGYKGQKTLDKMKSERLGIKNPFS